MDRDELTSLTLANGWMWPDSIERSERLGLDFHFPPDPQTGAAMVCPRGDHVLQKDNKSGRCQICRREAQATGSSGRPVSPQTAIMRECPDLILPRREAMAQGWSVFRTGEPCPNGHRGWRYVNNSQCTECKRKGA